MTAESSVAQHVTDSRWVVGSMTTQGVETVFRVRVVAGTVELPEGRRAVVWRDGAQLVRDTVGPARVAPRSPVNDRGQGTGTAGEGEGARAFVWADGVLTWLPTPEGASSESLGISENGRVVGVVSTLGAVVWEPDGAVRRLDPRGLGFVPADVSERGEVVGTVVASGGDTRPAIARGGEVVTLPSFGGYVGAASAVNERGVTAGWTRTVRHGADHPVFWHRQVPWRMGEEISGVPARSGRAYDVNEDNWLVGAVQVRNRTGTGFVDVAVLWEMSPEF